MAWNKYFIFVTATDKEGLDRLLQKLNGAHYKPVKEVPLHHSNKPETLFTGFVNNNLLIVHPDLPFHFFRNEPTETEALFCKTFPHSEIAVLVENSTVGLFSFALIQNGRKVRMMDGSDGEIYHDVGAPLPEEEEILAGEIFGEEEIAEMKEEGMTEEEVEAAIRFEALWRVPNLITRRYLGEPVGSIHPERVMLTMYA